MLPTSAAAVLLPHQCDAAREHDLMDGVDGKLSSDAPPGKFGLWSKDSLRIFLVPFVLLITLVPAIAYVHAFGVNAPFLDEWYFLQIYKDWQTHQVGWLEIVMRQHNVHRLGVAFAIELVLAKISHCNSIWQMYLFVVCRLLTALVLLDIFRTERADKHIPLGFGLLLGMQLFSLRQWENLLWGFQPCIALSCLFFVLMLWMLCKHVSSTAALYGGAVAALLATFSFGSGLISLPIGLLTIISQKNERAGKFRLQVAIWTVFCALSIGLYFWNFQAVSNVVRSENANRAIPFSERCLFFLACVGNSIGISENVCLLAGVLTLVVFALTVVVVAKTDGKDFSRAGAALCLFGIGSALMTAVGRCDEGLGRAVNSRYSSLTCFILLGIAMLAMRNKKLPHFLPKLAGFLIAYGWVISALTFWELGQPFKESREAIVPIVFNWELMNRATKFQLCQCPPQAFDSLVEFLRARRLSVFSDDREQPSAKASFQTGLIHASVASSEASDGRELHFRQAGNTNLIVSGWAVAADSAQPLLVDLFVDNRFRFVCQTGLDTKDVANALKNKEASKGGFAVVVQPSQFIAGKHSLKLRLYTKGGSEYRDYGPIGAITVD
jgi:hypothetical protein